MIQWRYQGYIKLNIKFPIRFEFNFPVSKTFRNQKEPSISLPRAPNTSYMQIKRMQIRNFAIKDTGWPKNWLSNQVRLTLTKKITLTKRKHNGRSFQWNKVFEDSPGCFRGGFYIKTTLYEMIFFVSHPSRTKPRMLDRWLMVQKWQTRNDELRHSAGKLKRPLHFLIKLFLHF